MRIVFLTVVSAQCQLDGAGSRHFRNGMYLEVEMAGGIHVAKITLVEVPANGNIHVQLETDRCVSGCGHSECGEWVWS